MTTDTALVLRCVRSDFTSRAGFRWPRPGEDLGHGPGVAVCPDWGPEPVCGSGLHGWLRGEGDPDAHVEVDPFVPSTVWLVVEVETSAVVALNGKVKFPRGTVVLAGSRQECHAEMLRRGQLGERALWRLAEGGDRSTLTGGHDSTLTGGYGSTLTGGNGSVLICRYWRKGWRVAVAVVDGDTIKAGVAYDYSVENGAWQESRRLGVMK